MIIREVLLLAGIGDVLGVLVPIVFFVIYLLNQLLSGKGNPQQQQQRGPQRRAAPQRPQAERAMRPPQAPGHAPAAPEPRGQAAQLNQEIEQFLKRAGQRRGESPQRERAATASESRPRAPRKPPAPQQRPSLRDEPIDVDVVPLDEPRRDSVAASVERHMQSGSFAQRAEHLADDIVRADQEMEDHMQAAFGRRVGTLAGETPAASGPVTDVQTSVVTDAPSPAAAFAQILRTPQGMREAVVLSEILARPEHRW
ncbi:MAG: hypothetical protein WD845_18370 [Pirellulales bacterium]